jgi:diguanylate cyclase (GGDEF)-like protein
MALLRLLRSYFGVRPDPYAGGDLGNANRIGTVLWGLVVVLLVLLLPASPPDKAIGGSGWIVAAGMVAAGAGVVYALHAQRFRSWSSLLSVSYAIVAGLGVMQWLAGGLHQPYEQLLLLPVVFVAAIQPPRKIAAFLGFVLVALAAPLVYDHWEVDAAGASGAGFVIWCGLCIGVNLLMSGVRAQRLAHISEEAQAREEARVDKLTGLHNRRAFDETLEVEVSRARRLEVPLCMGMVDLENFKEINDRWSYAEGDRVLCEFAETVKGAVREPDLIFRWGGDEFALILTGTRAEETQPLADRLRATVGEHVRRPDDEPLLARFAVAELGREMTPEELVEMAGLALTAAKLAGHR